MVRPIANRISRMPPLIQVIRAESVPSNANPLPASRWLELPLHGWTVGLLAC